MKAATYINKFKKENGTDDIMKIYLSEEGLIESSIAAIVCCIKRSMQEIIENKPLQYVVYIYREIIDDINVMHFDNLGEAEIYSRSIL